MNEMVVFWFQSLYGAKFSWRVNPSSEAKLLVQGSCPCLCCNYLSGGQWPPAAGRPQEAGARGKKH